MKAWSIPGAVVAVVERGEIRLLAGYGVSDVAAQTPVDPETTLFHVASISKPVTASAVLQLVERGRLDLHKPVTGYLKRFSVASPFPRDVTLAHLLTHTGGFDRRLVGRKTRRADDLGDLGDHLARNLPPIVRPPGEASVYSNYGYALAGFLVEEATDMPFARYVEENIFRPLGMRHSSFAIKPELEGALATGYGWRGALAPPVPRDYIRTGPASMLRTTAADMARWMLAILEGGAFGSARILQPSSTHLILARQFSNHPLLPGRSYGLSEGARFDPPEFLHAGGASGFTAALVLHPELRFGIFVAFNSQAPPWEIIRRVLDRFDQVLGTPRVPEPALDAFDAGRFAGTYRNAEIPVSSLPRLGELVEQVHVRSPGRGLIEWDGRIYEAISPLAFRERGGDRIVAFGESRGRIHYFFRRGGEYERLPWTASRPIQAGLWAYFFGGFLVAVVLWSISWLRGLRTRARPEPPMPMPRWPITVAFTASALNLAFILCLAVTLIRELGGEPLLEYGIPGWLLGVLAVPFATGALAVVAVCAAAVSWMRGWWTRQARAWYTAVAVTLVVFPPFLATWHLLNLSRL